VPRQAPSQPLREVGGPEPSLTGRLGPPLCAIIMGGPDKFFLAALTNRADVTDRYLNRTALISEVIGDAASNAVAFRKIVREQLEDPGNGRLGRIDQINQSIIDEIKQWQRDGLIGAADGKDSIPLTLLPDKLVYGVAICTVTSKALMKPKMKITHTFNRQAPPQDIEDLFELQTLLQESAEQSSWVRTYREFEEREAALALVMDGCRLVLIDGPIYTQNLLTQGAAQPRLLDRMQANQDHFIGFIKEQNPFHKHLSAALNRGEYFIFDRFKEMLARNRFRDDPNHPAVGWIRRAKHWVRCIYRVNQKAYEFECDEALIPYGLAMITVDRSEALNRELPFLLELVDRYVQASTDANNIAKDLLGALGPFTLTFENEREYR
jgi:hypothetical protein